jgi:hypothetical protein
VPQLPRATLLATLFLATGVTAADPVLFPDDRRPAILEQLELPGEVRILDIASDGNQAAYAVNVGEKKHLRAIVHVSSVEHPDPLELEVKGRIVDLLFSEDGGLLFAIHERPPRKRRSGENFLLLIETGTLKSRRDLYLPATSRALAFWPARNALLVASRNEIRTLLLPDLRSGPLFRILGENRSVASIGGSRILIGQDERLLIVDLADRPGDDQMPVRESVAVDAPVMDLAIDRSGGPGLARLADDRVIRIGIDPLSVAAADREIIARAAAPEPVPAAPVTAIALLDEQPDPPETPEIPTREPDEPEPAGSAAVSTGVPAIAPEENVLDPGAVQVRGEISGPERADVVAVVLFGPDNILLEASRVVPDVSGSWQVEGLAPGRYRVVVDGGGRNVLVSEPAFHVVEIQVESALIEIDFRVSQSL